MGKITIFKNIHSATNPFHREINVSFERIKNGSSKDKVLHIRHLKTKQERDEKKKDLPSICYSGMFKVRKKNACLEHSGYICLDFDGFDSEDKLTKKRGELEKDQYTFALFTSPSGQGLKVIVKIPAEIENHEKYFNALQNYYDCPNFDISTKDISRVCYESYDPDIYVNEKSLTWVKKPDVETYNYSEKKPTLPLRSTNMIISNLQKWVDVNFPIVKGLRNENMFRFACALNAYGVSEFEARTYLDRYESSDFTQREIHRIVESAYSKKSEHGTKYFEDTNTKNYIKKELRAGRDTKKIKSKIEITDDEFDNVVEEIEENSTISEFWYFDEKGNCKISNLKFKHFLEQNGFCKYYPEGGESYIFIRLENSFVENTSAQKIKDFVLEYLLKQQTLKPYELMASATKFFKDDYLSLIKSEKIHIYEDAETFAMLYFRNCAVKVFKEKVEKIDYLSLDGMVWKEHVIDRDFTESVFEGCIFDRFVDRIANSNIDRKNSIMAVIGYLLHSYKTSANNKAIILNDELISENPNGGSGKGIICNAISKLKRVGILDGKQFDLNKSFLYQTVNIDTQVLVFDDVKKNFPFESLFSLITEGITIERKNKDAIKVPVKKSPKILITTNYTVGGMGGSFERRKYEVEMSSYFSVNHTPFDEFGLMLFDDFSIDEWLKFDNFMINCIKLYLINGLVKHEFKNLGIRKFINDTSFEFYEWVMEGNIEIGERNYKSEKWKLFLTDYPDFDSSKFKLSQKKFANWLDSLAFFLKKPIVADKDIRGRYVLIGEEREPASFWDNIKTNYKDEVPF